MNKKITCIQYALVLLAAGLTLADANDAATFFMEPGFEGKAVTLPAGDYDTARMVAHGLPDDSIASLKVGKGFQVVAYVHDNFQGNSRVFTDGVNGSAPRLYTDDFDASPIIQLSPLIQENMRVDDDLTGRISSLRIFKPVIEDPVVRDNRAEQQALDGWWADSMKGRDERLQWWREAKFGCFMHWGAYSVLGGMWEGRSTGTYSEHIQRQVMLPLDVYKEATVEKFNPVEFDADEWVRLLREAGMKYLIITAKHHDGFAVYHSDAYYYDMELTPFKRDPMLELREACTRHGLKFGFYYSQAFDWEHPDGAGNDWEYSNPGGDLGLFGGKQWHRKHPELVPRVGRYYIDGKAIPQLLELIRKYQPDILWGDTDAKLPLSEKLRMLKAVREADPDIVINGRFCRGGKTKNFGDYVNTADRPAEVRGVEGDWEAIPTTNESYGYKQDDRSHKPLSYFIQLLAKVAARGGNTLMNIGPRPDGRIDEPDVAILKGIGQWMQINGESIHGTERTPLEVQAWGQSTRKGHQIYLHVFHWPEDGKLIIGGLKSNVEKAWLLADADQQPLETRRLNPNDLVVSVPGQAPDPFNSVVVLKTAGQVETAPGRLLSTTLDNVLHVFDAQCSSTLGFGDGKATRDYVRHWTRPEQQVWWTIRANEAATYRLSLKYTTENQQVEGNRYRMTIGEHTFVKTVEPSSQPAIVDFGTVEIPAGASEVKVEPVEIKSGELMKLYNVVLKPL